jgi:hypothetical protein
LPIATSAATFLQVGVKSGQLRATPTPFGKILATPGYGECVEQLETSGPWQRVRFGKTEGWMHNTLLTSKTTNLSAGKKGVGSAASSEELTLAGKGFNAQVESAYRQGHRALDYATIDRMEGLVVSQNQMSRFLADGGVTPEEGAQ